MSKAMPTVFLIGATGTIGKALLAELAPDHLAGRLRVQAGARCAASADHAIKAGVQAVAFDLAHFARFDQAFAGVSTVFLLRPYTLHQMMYGKQVIDAARRAGVAAIVTLGAYGRADTPWSVIGWNFLVEAYAERSGLAWTHLRPNYFMDNVLVQRDPGTGTIFNRVCPVVSWISAADIAACAAAVLRMPADHAGRSYNLASHAASIEEVAALFSALTGRPHTVGRTPPEKVMERLLAQGREPDYAQALIDYVDAVNQGRVAEIADVFDSVEQLAGRCAETWPRFIARAAHEGRL